MMTPDDLLAGPRGRRMLLELLRQLACAEQEDASAAAPASNPEPSPLSQALFAASYCMDPGAGYSLAVYEPGDRDPAEPTAHELFMADPVGASEVLAELCRTQLPPPTEAQVRQALEDAVASAAYWQPPRG